MMEEFYLEWLPDSKPFIALFSIIVNVIIAISGVLPSAFLTAANIAVFDFKMGLTVSIIGEALGAVISFILYRKGLAKLSDQVQQKNKFLLRLHHSRGLEAIFLVLTLRILPFVPSGVVTLFAAYSKMGLISFAIASTLGKIPSLFMEAFAVDRALELSTGWQLILIGLLLLLYVLYYVWKRIRK